MNTFIQTMKNALTGYYNAALAYEEKAQNARRIYQQDVAEQEVQKIHERLYQDKAAAIDAINEARDRGIRAAYAWGELDGAKINEDARLLKFDLSPEQFEAIVQRNRNNGTMCFVLKQYAENHAKREKKEDEAPAWDAFAMVTVPTVEAKVHAYNEFADSALSTIESMSGADWQFGVNSPITQSVVQRFGEPNGVNDELLEVIG